MTLTLTLPKTLPGSTWVLMPSLVLINRLAGHRQQTNRQTNREIYRLLLCRLCSLFETCTRLPYHNLVTALSNRVITVRKCYSQKSERWNSSRVTRPRQQWEFVQLVCKVNWKNRHYYKLTEPSAQSSGEANGLRHIQWPVTGHAEWWGMGSS